MNKHLKFFDQLVDLTNPESVLKLTNDCNELSLENQSLRTANLSLNESLTEALKKNDNLTLEVSRLKTELKNKPAVSSREIEYKQEAQRWKKLYEEMQIKYKNATQRSLPPSNRFLLPGGN